MKFKHYKYYPVCTFLLGCPIIYEYHMHPVYAFIIAFLFSWLILEDFFTQLIDLRVSVAFAAMVIAMRPQMLLSAIFIYLFFQILFYAFAKYKRPNANEDYLDPCPLQEGIHMGFVPLLGAASFIVLSVDMIWNPMSGLVKAAMNGNLLAGKIIQTHRYVEVLNVYFSQNPYMIYMILLIMFAVVMLLYFRGRHKREKGYVAYYSFGNGDSLVLASLTALFGLECFFFIVLMLSILFGEGYRLVQYVLRRGGDSWD